MQEQECLASSRFRTFIHLESPAFTGLYRFDGVIFSKLTENLIIVAPLLQCDLCSVRPRIHEQLAVLLPDHNLSIALAGFRRIERHIR